MQVPWKDNDGGASVGRPRLVVPPSDEVIRENVRAIDRFAMEAFPGPLAGIWAGFPPLPNPADELKVRVVVLEAIVDLLACELDHRDGL